MTKDDFLQTLPKELLIVHLITKLSMRGKTTAHKTVTALFYPAILNQVFKKRKEKIRRHSNFFALISFQAFNTGLKVQFVLRTEGSSDFHVSHHS